MIPIVFSTDHNYVMQTGVCIYSLLTSASYSIYEIFVIVNDDVTEKDKSQLKKQVMLFPGHSINFMEIGEIFKDCYEVRGVSTASYSRLLIPWILPNHDKVIYSDVDIIFKTDLDPLFRIDVSDSLVAGVNIALDSKNSSFSKYIIKNGLNPNEYINTGLLVINSKMQRALKLRQKYLDKTRINYLYQDQDIINIVCKGRIQHIPIIYNQ